MVIGQELIGRVDQHSTRYVFLWKNDANLLPLLRMRIEDLWKFWKNSGYERWRARIRMPEYHSLLSKSDDGRNSAETKHSKHLHRFFNEQKVPPGKLCPPNVARLEIGKRSSRWLHCSRLVFVNWAPFWVLSDHAYTVCRAASTTLHEPRRSRIHESASIVSMQFNLNAFFADCFSYSWLAFFCDKFPHVSSASHY